MRIDSISIENFRGFDSFDCQLHPEFSLIVGENGTGKTAILEALSISIGSWLLGFPGYNSRGIKSSDIRLSLFDYKESPSWEEQLPVVIKANGTVTGESISWSRSLNTPNGRTTYADASSIRLLAQMANEFVRGGSEALIPIDLPIVSYYGTERLWGFPKHSLKTGPSEKVKSQKKHSRLDAYSTSVEPRLSVTELMDWTRRQSWITFQNNGAEPSVLSVFKHALIQNIPRAEHFGYDASFDEVIVGFEGGEKQLFRNLSDGQRCMLSLVGDLARKVGVLNPHLKERALDETSGVVLIDELDLHLHPKWQRKVIEALRTTFPRIQFVCTTHSPFLIQSLRSGGELIVLDGQSSAQLGDRSLEAIAREVQGVSNTQVSERYQEMRSVARSYLQELSVAAQAPRDRLESYLRDLAESIEPFADNPAFQAFLEMRRTTELGE